jgi:hypothetical protein
MWQYALKVGLSAIVIVAVAEIGKRSSFWGAALASLPLVSLLALIWLYVETGNKESVAALSGGIFWLVLPTLPFFLLLPVLLRAGWSFWPSLGVASLVTVLLYLGLVGLLEHFGVRL